MIGSVTDCAQPDGDVVKFTYPVGLNQPRLIANTSTRPSAIRNPGMANPSTVITCTTRSTQPPRTAAHTPSSTEMIAITTVAPTTIDNVTASRDVMPCTTGCPVNQESPKSPVSAFFSHVVYWVNSGSFRPSCWAFCATASCEADCPRMRRAMSPPPRYSRKNATEVMTNNNSKPANNRFRMNRNIVVPL